MSAPGEVVLAIRGVTKRFGGTLALDRIDLAVRAGEIHAFLGANGAGKSTLIRILAGVHAADGGEILWHNVPISNAETARRIAIVHQDLGLIDFMSVGENMAMGYGYPRRGNGLIDWGAVEAKAARVLADLDAPLPLHTAVSALSPAERSLVAIARAVSRDVELLILDEPTASLPEADVGRLFAALRRLKAKNVAIIYVTHRLDEVFRIADAATVIRDGRTVAVHDTLDTVSSDQLVSEIVGHLPQRSDKRALAARKPVLEVEGLRSYAIGPVSFSLGEGEILGLAGLRAQGHEGVGRMIAGVYRPTGGRVTLDGRGLDATSTADAIRAGIGFCTGRRAEEAVAPAMTVKENLFLNPLNFEARRFRLRDLKAEMREAATILSRFAVKPSDPGRDISTLSGGNQQKVVLARWAGQKYRVIVLEDPTIGVDIGAKSEIYRMMRSDCESGTSYIVVSSDIEELANVCDRVLAFSRGQIVAELAGDRLTTETLTHAVSGALGAPQELAS
ncbi:MAG TPA: sugar ABC transporter ATP-binding protein [Xanthobacteraceae bacterium]|nr:sugar ABC transporter ATP-binding protein [Xanthobacteraceae bacterium]